MPRSGSPYLSALLLAAAFVVLPASAQAATPLSVSVNETLSSIAAPVEVRFRGALPSPVVDATVAVIVRGPGLPRTGTGNWPVAARVDQSLGAVAAGFDLSLSIPADSLKTPGAYEITVELTPLGGPTLTGWCWLGRLADPPAEVDLAMVWPITLGVHQDPDGAFVDGAIQSSLAAPPESPGSVFALLSLADALPTWHVTLAVDPAYLDQVLDLSTEGSKDSDRGGSGVASAGHVQAGRTGGFHPGDPHTLRQPGIHIAGRRALD